MALTTSRVDGPEDNTESIPTTMVKMVKREVVTTVAA